MKTSSSCNLVSQAEERNTIRLRRRKEKIGELIDMKRKANSKKSNSASVEIEEIANQLQKKDKSEVEIKEELNKLINTFSDNNIEILNIIEKEKIPELLMKLNIDNSNLLRIIIDIFTIFTYQSKTFSQLLINKGIFDFIKKNLQKGYYNNTDMIISSMVKLLINIIYDYEQSIVDKSDFFLIIIRYFLLNNQNSLQTSLNIIELLIKVITKLKIEVKDVLTMTNKIVDIIPSLYNNIDGIEIVVKLLIKLIAEYDDVVFSVTSLHDVIVPLFSVLIDNIRTTTRPILYFNMISIYLNKNRNDKILNLLLEKKFNKIIVQYLNSKEEDLLLSLACILSSLVVDLKSFFTSELISEIIEIAETSKNFLICSHLHSVLCNLAYLDELMERFQFLNSILVVMNKYSNDLDIIGMGYEVTKKYLENYKENKTGLINDIPFLKFQNTINQIEKKASNERTKEIIGQLIQLIETL